MNKEHGFLGPAVPHCMRASLADLFNGASGRHKLSASFVFSLIGRVSVATQKLETERESSSPN